MYIYKNELAKGVDLARGKSMYRRQGGEDMVGKGYNDAGGY